MKINQISQIRLYYDPSYNATSRLVSSTKIPLACTSNPNKVFFCQKFLSIFVTFDWEEPIFGRIQKHENSDSSTP